LLLIPMTGEENCTYMLLDHVIESHYLSLDQNGSKNGFEVGRKDRALCGVFHQTFGGCVQSDQVSRPGPLHGRVQQIGSQLGRGVPICPAMLSTIRDSRTGMSSLRSRNEGFL
jgi:hypothetical protein